MHRLPDMRRGLSAAGIDTHAGGERDGGGAVDPVRNLCRCVSGFGDGDIGHGVFG